MMVAGKSLLLGDRAADLLLAYAALVAQVRRGDHVSVRAIREDGDEVEVGVLLNSGSVLVIESSTSPLPEPDNTAAIAYMTAQLDSFGLSGQDDPHPFDANPVDDSSAGS